ncbi:MAG: hypothetical protein DRP94_07505 [Candidatus Latescibacterota bacterium]|nr:MAG: hypothetical protein DRP94_07505 [Candidatus Latescibacterota bacterium]RKY73638.1 MAG: hypothetical protein DRQ14_03695 [Candidatus Latescibacterota bacterium]
MRAAWLALVACAFVAGTVYAGTGPDILIPYIDASRVTIDGAGTEWEDPTFYPQEMMLSSTDNPEYFGIVTGSEPSGPEDWSAVLYLGWGTDNFLYGYSRVTDDILLIGVPRNGDAWKEDDLEMVVDADNSGGDYRTGIHAENAQQFGIRLGELPLEPGADEDATRCHIWAKEEAKWMSGPDYFYAEVVTPTETENVTYAFEWKLALWDEGAASPEDAVRHDLLASYNAGEPIGFGVAWDDADTELGTRDTQIGTMGPEGNAFWKNADHCNDAYLVDNPLYEVGTTVAVEPSSWGALKASFK